MESNHSVRSRRNLSVLLPALSLLLGFLAVFAGLNLYKYLTTRQDFSSNVLQSIAKGNFERIDSFFKGVANQLTIVRDLGRNGVLDKSDIVSLNKKFIPLLKNQKVFSGIILSDSTGWEYFLFQEDGSWVTRITGTKGNNVTVFIKWSKPDKPFKRWEKISDYDPRTRPWFKQEEDKVHWSTVYTFFQTGRPGVTASIAWRTQAGQPVTTVFAVDIPVSHLEQVLQMKKSRSGVMPFLLDSRSKKVIAGKIEPLQEDKINYHLLLTATVKKWETEGKPEGKPFGLKFDSNGWISLMMPITSTSKDFWFGIVAPEKIILADLKQTFFRFDPKDIMVAVLGGLALVLLVWRFGGLGRAVQKEVTDPLMRLHDYIKSGEGDKVEFKSTIRTNLRTGKQGKEIELAWLKAVVAFLNSEGGTVLIGVDDSGRIVGVEQDGFDNPDRCMLHVKNLINQHVGAEFSSFINTTMVEVDGKEVVLIECLSSNKPVFLKIGKNEEFYVRTGPSSVKLSPSQTINYLLHSGRLKA